MDDQQGNHREAVTLEARNVLFEGTRSQNGNSSPQGAVTTPATGAAPAPAATTAQQPAATKSTATASELPF